MASQVPPATSATSPPPQLKRLDLNTQSFWKRGLDKCKQQPFVPLGAFVTCIALGGAFRELRRGNSHNLNRYLRFRVVAQGATVAAMVAGSYIYGSTIKEQKEEEDMLERARMLELLANAGESSPRLAAEAGQQELIQETPRPKRVQYTIKKDGSGGGLDDFWKKTEGQVPTSSNATGSPTTDTQEPSSSSL